MSTLSLDDNQRVTMLRTGKPVGGFFSPGSGDKSTTEWNRLMPHGDTAELVSDNDLQLNIGTLRNDLIGIHDDHDVMILNAGYFQQLRVQAESDGILTLHEPIKHRTGLQTLGSTIEYVLFPRLIFPIGLYYISSAAGDELEIGFAKDDAYDPSTVVKYMQIANKEQFKIPNRQLQHLFYKFTNLTDGATHSISWGEHFRVR